MTGAATESLMNISEEPYERLSYNKSMTLERAEEIVHEYGAHLEKFSEILGRLFMVYIPESTLPYPKSTILEAHDMLIKYCHENKDSGTEELLKGTRAMLDGYIDDEEALTKASEHFASPEWRSVLIKSLKEYQKEA